MQGNLSQGEQGRERNLFRLLVTEIKNTLFLIQSNDLIEKPHELSNLYEYLFQNKDFIFLKK